MISRQNHIWVAATIQRVDSDTNVLDSTRLHEGYDSWKKTLQHGVHRKGQTWQMFDDSFVGCIGSTGSCGPHEIRTYYMAEQTRQHNNIASSDGRLQRNFSSSRHASSRGFESSSAVTEKSRGAFESTDVGRTKLGSYTWHED